MKPTLISRLELLKEQRTAATSPVEQAMASAQIKRYEKAKLARNEQLRASYEEQMAIRFAEEQCDEPVEEAPKPSRKKKETVNVD